MLLLVVGVGQPSTQQLLLLRMAAVVAFVL
jgi:hypothetical protein